MEIEAAKVIGAGLAVIGVIGSGIGIGNIFSSFIQAVGRNPAARSEVFTMTMLGFALVEAIALFALVIAIQPAGLNADSHVPNMSFNFLPKRRN